MYIVIYYIVITIVNFLFALMSLVSFNSIKTSAYLTLFLAAQTVSLYFSQAASLLPPSVCFLFVTEFVQELFIHPHRPLDIFCFISPLY